jgi:hypothetical protein
MLHTTFELARMHNPCLGSYRKAVRALGGIKTYGKDTPIPLTRVYEICGLDDALWCLRCVLPEEEEERDKVARLLACTYAEGVARRFALGLATTEELASAGAWAADAAWAASYAAWAASGADGAAEHKWQSEQFLMAMEASDE